MRLSVKNFSKSGTASYRAEFYASKMPHRAIFMDSSTQNNLLGIWRAFADGQPFFHRTTGKAQPNYIAELRVVHHAIKLIEQGLRREFRANYKISIYSDCQRALKALARPHHQARQRIPPEIIGAVGVLEEMGH